MSVVDLDKKDEQRQLLDEQCHQVVRKLFSSDLKTICQGMAGIYQLIKESENKEQCEDNKPSVIQAMKSLSVPLMVLYAIDQNLSSVGATAVVSLFHLIKEEDKDSQLLKTLREANAIEVICRVLPSPKADNYRGRLHIPSHLEAVECALKALCHFVGTSEEHGLTLARNDGFRILTTCLESRTMLESTECLTLCLCIFDNLSPYASVCQYMIQTNCVMLLLQHSSANRFSGIKDGNLKVRSIVQKLAAFAIPSDGDSSSSEEGGFDVVDE